MDNFKQHTNYLEKLNEGYELAKRLSKDANCDLSKEGYLSKYIFEFITYDTEKDNLFGSKALEFCLTISNNETLSYIEESQDNYTWFVMMVNYSFFYPFLDWGTSIRGVWWDFDKKEIEIPIYDLEPSVTTDKYENRSWLNLEQWENFIFAMDYFV